EAGEASGHLLQQVIGTDEVGTCLACCHRTITRGEDQDRGRLAGAVGQVDGAAHHPVGLAGIDTQAQGDLYGAVELQHRGLLSQGDRLCRFVLSIRSNLLCGGPVGLRALCHLLHLLAVVVRAARTLPLGVWDSGESQLSVVMPIERAVPATILDAASMLFALRSAILSSAISRTWSAERCPTLSVCGVAEPDLTPAAFLMSSAAGGVFVMNENERSSYTVISTGMTFPRWDSVAALYALQNSMMLTPCCPSAGPIGAAGLAAPAWICSLIRPATFFLGG